MKRVRLSPREKVSKLLDNAGFDALPDDIVFIQGGPYKNWEDILECWHVTAYDSSGGKVQITGADTLTECSRGIYLEENTPRSDYYGDWVCYSKRQTKKVLPAT